MDLFLKTIQKLRRPSWGQHSFHLFSVVWPTLKLDFIEMFKCIKNVLVFTVVKKNPSHFIALKMLFLFDLKNK